MKKLLKLNSYPFDGWDFMEFSEAWNIPVPYNSFGGPYTDADCIKWYLESVLRYDKETRPMKKCAKDIRIFTDKLSRSKYDYKSPMWVGMSKIENDWTIIKVAIALMDMMWD